MILAFLRAEIDAPRWQNVHVAALAHLRANRSRLIDRADLGDAQQNRERLAGLRDSRGYGQNKYLFFRFPPDATWRLVVVSPTEIKTFKYINDSSDPRWSRLSAGTRLVGDGIQNLDEAQNAEVNGNVTSIATRLRQGERFPALIAAQRSGSAELVLIEGHNRATAYALTGIPKEIEVFIGTSPDMADWPFY
jgi:hypothetical protein